MFNFMQYSFFFPPEVKADFLGLESKILQNLELRKAINTMGAISIYTLMFEENLYLDLHLRRDHLIEDTLN